MGEIYQRAVADGSPDWSPGADTFDACWDVAFDKLRFHRGKGFRVTDRSEARPQPGPVRKLAELHDLLGPQLKRATPDTVLEVRSELDGYGLILRRHATPATKAEIILANATSLIGTPYVLGGTDCSWLTMHCYGKVGITLPHNAHAQHLAAQVIEISRAQIKPADLLFHHNDQHVSLYLDGQGAGRVIDEEPHSTGAPPGWPTPQTGVGCQIRPMTDRYYTDWANVNGIGRIRAVNG